MQYHFGIKLARMQIKLIFASSRILPQHLDQGGLDIANITRPVDSDLKLFSSEKQVFGSLKIHNDSNSRLHPNLHLYHWL